MNILYPMLLPALIIYSGTAVSQSKYGTVENAESTEVAFPLGEESSVVQVTYVGGYIDSEDRISTRVFAEESADGYKYVLESYRPAYMKNSGRYRSDITKEEFEELVQAFGSDQMISMSSNDLEAQLNQEVRSNPAGSIIQNKTHDVQVEVEYSVVEQSDALQSLSVSSLRLPNAMLRSEIASPGSALNSFAKGVVALEKLVDLKNLEKVE